MHRRDTAALRIIYWPKKEKRRRRKEEKRKNFILQTGIIKKKSGGYNREKINAASKQLYRLLQLVFLEQGTGCYFDSKTK